MFGGGFVKMGGGLMRCFGYTLFDWLNVVLILPHFHTKPPQDPSPRVLITVGGEVAGNTGLVH